MKRMIALLAAMLLAMSISGTALANQGQGQGNAPDRADSGNSLISESEAMTVTEVQPEVGNPTAGNFDEQFIYYKVTYETVEYDTWVYREPDRLGGDNFVIELEDGETASSSAFWYGVSGPVDGVQHEIVHEGNVWQYFGLGDEWQHLKANFAVNDFGHGLLTDINGVGPEGVFGDIEWTSAPGAELRSTFSTAQGKVVTTNVETEDTWSIDVDCTIVDGDEAFLSGTNNEDNPAIFYVRGGDNPGIGQWTDSGLTCEDRWVGGGTVDDGFIEGLD